MSFLTALLQPRFTRVSRPQFARQASGLRRRSLRAASPCVLAAVASLAGAVTGVARAQEPDAFVKWAAARAIPVRTVEADGDASDLSFPSRRSSDLPASSRWASRCTARTSLLRSGIG
jgi:hypothetical protein